MNKLIKAWHNRANCFKLANHTISHSGYSLLAKAQTPAERALIVIVIHKREI